MAEPFSNGRAAERNGAHTIRFGGFEADLRAGEVRKEGARIKLQEQPFKVLQILLERPGDLVTRDELQSRIWPAETFGDFDHAVNVAVGKLRSALGDSAEAPAYIETVPRRGYRFVAKVDSLPVETPQPPQILPVLLPPPAAPASRWKYRSTGIVLLAMLVAAALLALGVFLGHRTARRPQAPEFQRLSVRHGTVYSARFAPDGQGILYSAAWDGGPIEIFSTDHKGSGTRSLDMPATHLLAISPAGELAVLQSTDLRFMLTVQGTLGRVPLSGGVPRQMAAGVEAADWSPDGKTLAVVREINGKRRLEFPLGHVLYETRGWVSHARLSPRGDRIAFLDHPTLHDDQGVVAMVDLAGHREVLSSGWESEEGLAWAPDGNEVWFSATRAGLERRIFAVDLAGHQRLAYRALGGVTLQDIAQDGQVLLTRDENRAGMIGLAPGAAKEKDLSWLDWSLPSDLSSDGNTLLFGEEGEQSGPTYTVATRDLNGSAPVALGEGMAGDLSPDGKWAAASISYKRIELLPTGVGTSRRIDPGGIEQFSHVIHWSPDGKQLVFPANLPGQSARCFIQNIDGGKPKPVTPEGVTGCWISPDGQAVVGQSREDSNLAQLYPLDGSAPHPVPGLLPGEAFLWSGDPHVLYVYQWKRQPLRIYRLNVVTGQRQFFKELRANDPIGLCDMSHVLISRDGRAYVFSYTRMLSDLFLVKGLS
jgi:DNA-binding winged helix-turn-helix (wHTH) protein